MSLCTFKAYRIHKTMSVERINGKLKMKVNALEARVEFIMDL